MGRLYENIQLMLVPIDTGRRLNVHKVHVFNVRPVSTGEFLKAPFLVLHFSFYTLMNFLMILFVILLFMLIILLSVISVIRLISGNN